ncbi:MAG: cystathionine gamma-synthase family protein [Gemmatimonadetes bacterium]|nr:cystathionine gamma-synthase family protein [Gemmatimonadota bacterium]
MMEGKPRLNGHDLRPESVMMSWGYHPEWSEGALKCPIFQTSTFVFRTAEEGKAFFELAYGLREPAPAENRGLIYSRLNNPDLEILEDRLTLWDSAQACAVFESGMAAIATTLLTFLRPGDAIVHSEPVYGGTEYLLHHVLTGFGITPNAFPAGAGPEALERVVTAAKEKGRLALIYVETPANPTNVIVDITHCAEVARRESTDRKILVAVDNTFLGPLWQHPLTHGADLVLYSLTKYVGGHSDVIAGACLGSRELLSEVRALRTFLGTMAGPWTGWLLLRSLETLKLRMTCEMKNARYLADFLADHPRVNRVYYLGHLDEDDPQHEIYRRQCHAPGAMISFDIHGGEAEAFRFLNALKLIKLAVSLGGTESLAEHPATMTHSDIPPQDQSRMGITPAMIRLSVGVEHPSDLIADLEQALEAA